VSAPIEITPIASRESAETKGRRYLLEGRLSVKCVTDRLILANCHGDQGDEYAVGWDKKLSDWRCTCPARGRCAHIVALSLVVGKPE
jgi:uncharacterized Zn finger protein